MAGRGEIVKRVTSKGETRYLARVWSGKRRSISKTFRTKKEAEAWKAQKITEVNTRGLIVPSKQLFSDFLKSWLKTWKTELRPHIHAHYSKTLHRYVIAPSERMPEAVRALELGSVPLGSLKPEDFQLLYNAMGESRQRARRYLDTLLRQALKKAVSLRYISESPLAVVDAPGTVANKRANRCVLSAEQMSRFLEAIDSHRHRALWIITLQHGLRPGEALALRWRDVDLAARTMSISATLTPDRRIGPAKTENATRTLRLTQRAVQALASHRLQAGERAVDPDALVFVTETGTPEHMNNVSRRWRTLKDALGPSIIPPAMTMYELRHSYASLMLKQGANIADVSKQLGHANVRITLQAYAWALEDASEELADKMDQALDSVKMGSTKG
jgi:integrase